MRARHLAAINANGPEVTPDEELAEDAQKTEEILPPEDATDTDASAPEGADLTDEGEDPSEEEPEIPLPPIELPLVTALRAQLSEKDEQLKSYIAAYKEASADMVRERSRLERERERLADRDRMDLAGPLLEVLDNLDRSVTSAQEGGSSEDLLVGLGLVRQQFVAALGTMGVDRIQSLGETFDAAVHEATGMIPASGEQRDQEVIFEERPGYRYKEKLLRPARVVVASRSD